MASSGLVRGARKSLAMGPSVKNLLTQYKLDPNQIASTGPHQTLLKSDVLSFINKRNLEPGNENASTKIRSNSEQDAKLMVESATGLPKLNTKVIRASRDSILSSKYNRKYPSQLEIDVINNGGPLN